MKKVKIAGLAAAALLAITPTTGTVSAADTTTDSGFNISNVTDMVKNFVGFFQDIADKIQGISGNDGSKTRLKMSINWLRTFLIA
ncbi:hypothetical protein [Companilactobacillus furfuricola]|uniref:hypothetical protein n=1 Tax=Companilactobacillus furfuricola TaxID=1462575 RepID=UPI000F7ADF59|nr:hypothetical protein [Companilactobacillus furfuricola]